MISAGGLHFDNFAVATILSFILPNLFSPTNYIISKIVLKYVTCTLVILFVYTYKRIRTFTTSR